MTQPLVCDLTGSGQTPAERLQQFRTVFGALAGRSRTDRGIRFRFRCDAVDEQHLRDLASREQACCAFFEIEVMRVGDELWWDTAVGADPAARAVLEDFFRLPESLLGAAPQDCLPTSGLVILADEHEADDALC